MSTRCLKVALCFLTVVLAVLSASCVEEFTFRVTLERSVEDVFWHTVEDGGSAAGLMAYLERWPDGQYASEARRRLSIEGRLTPGAGTVSEETNLPVGALRSEDTVDRTFGEPGRTFRDCADCPAMVVLPSGTFRMGSVGGQGDERPVRAVRVQTFALGKHEVTRGEFGAFAAATGYVADGCDVIDEDASQGWNKGASWRSPGFPQEDGQPVVCVSWEGAEAYVRWLAGATGEPYRLPSEAEWEYGARAGTETRRYWGPASGGACRHANSGDRSLMRRWGGWPLPFVDCVDGAAHTSEAAAYEPNSFGLHDMLGNVWEWTADCLHESYRNAPPDGAAWTRGGNCARRVLRGGSWETPFVGIRAANRYWSSNRASNSVGFRVARNLR